MQGVITSRDVIRHLPLIWREFGTACVFKCLRAMVKKEQTTFLDVALGCTQLPSPAAPLRRELKN